MDDFSGTRVFLLIQWKHAIKLEQLGMKHSSGRSVRAHAAKMLGLKPRAKVDDVLAAIEAKLDEQKRLRSIPQA